MVCSRQKEECNEDYVEGWLQKDAREAPPPSPIYRSFSPRILVRRFARKICENFEVKINKKHKDAIGDGEADDGKYQRRSVARSRPTEHGMFDAALNGMLLVSKCWIFSFRHRQFETVVAWADGRKGMRDESWWRPGIFETHFTTLECAVENERSVTTCG